MYIDFVIIYYAHVIFLFRCKVTLEILEEAVPKTSITSSREGLKTTWRVQFIAHDTIPHGQEQTTGTNTHKHGHGCTDTHTDTDRDMASNKYTDTDTDVAPHGH